jgi:hypothetical protein
MQSVKQLLDALFVYGLYELFVHLSLNWLVHLYQNFGMDFCATDFTVYKGSRE